MKPIWKYSILTACTVVVLGYIVVGLSVSKHREQTKTCRNLQVLILDSASRQYISPVEIAGLIDSKGLDPKRKTSDEVSLEEIEQLVRCHDVVRSVECYYNAQNDVVVALTQRVPVLRVVQGGHTYLADDMHKIMHARPSITTPMLVAKGAVSEHLATNELVSLAQWLSKDTYWKERIDTVNMLTPHMAQLYPRDGNPAIVLGELTNVDKKLHRMQRWMESGLNIDMAQYEKIDLRFDGQVVGVRK